MGSLVPRLANRTQVSDEKLGDDLGTRLGDECDFTEYRECNTESTLKYT